MNNVVVPSTLLCEFTAVKQYANGRYALRCTRPGCKNYLSSTRTLNPFAKCNIQPLKVFLFGTTIAKFLRLFGVTPKRIERITRRPCGCKQKARRLDRWGTQVFLRWHNWRHRLWRRILGI